MAVKLVFFMLWLCGSMIVLAGATPQPPPPSVTKKNCTHKCGNVAIPFPFGIERGCFLNEWFEIECRSNGTVPRLKKIDVDVLSIALPQYPDDNAQNGATSGLVEVSLPIIPSNGNCTRNKTTPQVLKNLQGSPLFYSADNLFVVFGCNQFVVINNANYSVLRGCKPYCNGRSFGRYSNCLGTDGCCRADLLALQESRVHFLKETEETGDGQECSYAFVANQTWLESEMRIGVADLFSIVAEGYVPGVINWGIFETDLVQELAMSSSVSCYTIFDGKRPIRECICNPGHRGNPYLVNGCEVTALCKEHPNMNLCLSNSSAVVVASSNHDKILKQGLIGMGSGFGTILLLLVSWKSYDVTKKRAETKRKLKFFERNGGVLLQQQLSSPGGAVVEKSKLFGSTELDKATDNFNKDRILGQGGQGTVYKGMLSDGRIVAIKKSKAIDAGKVEKFINEVVILSQINHRNVVKLLGFCLETEIPLLVYEFVPNGTLYRFLHEPNEELILVSWETRLRVAREVAAALSYLHSAASIPIYHRDIKSTNILLDEKYRAKVADFGTSRSVSLDQTHLTTLVQGTFGYLDPQYFQSNQFTDKSDVYSFGVVLVELLTGQKAVTSVLAQEGMGLASYFIVCMEEKKLFDILDPQILSEENVKKEEIETVAFLAKRCLNLNGRKRPAMKEVTMVLEGIGKPDNGTGRNEELSRCSSSISEEASETDDDEMPYSNVVACNSSSSMSDVDPIIYGQTR